MKYNKIMENLEDRSINSLHFEKMIEHRFISDIMAYCWHIKNETLEIMHAEIDSNGYDLLVCYKNINRYIQLKTSEEKSTTSTQNINLSLKNNFNFKYLFWGSRIDESLPDTDKYKIAKSTTANSKGIKKDRQNFRVIPKKEFMEFDNIEKLFDQLFSKE